MGKDAQNIPVLIQMGEGGANDNFIPEITSCVWQMAFHIKDKLLEL